MVDETNQHEKKVLIQVLDSVEFNNFVNDANSHLSHCDSMHGREESICDNYSEYYEDSDNTFLNNQDVLSNSATVSVGHSSIKKRRRDK